MNRWVGSGNDLTIPEIKTSSTEAVSLYSVINSMRGVTEEDYHPLFSVVPLTIMA